MSPPAFPSDPARLPELYPELASMPGLRVDLRYAGNANFLGRPLYPAGTRARLHALAWTKLQAALGLLRAEAPELGLLVLDALRPRSVQALLFAVVAGGPFQDYVADPAKGSPHNRGLAVDLTLCGPDGAELDLGTPFDDFGELAQPRLEEVHAAAGRLSPPQLQRRRLLRRVMLGAGFRALPIEWWHFDAVAPEDLGGYPILE